MTPLEFPWPFNVDARRPDLAATPDIAAQILFLYGLGLTILAIAILETTLARDLDEPTHRILSPALKAVVGAALVVCAIAIPPLPTTGLFAIGLVALGVPACYGALV